MDAGIVAGLAGIVGATSSALVTGHLQRAVSKQDASRARRERDLVEWRELLDAAIEDLQVYVEVCRGSCGRFCFSDSSAMTKSAFDAIFDPVIDAKRAAHVHDRRMQLRLGRQSAVTVAYRGAVALCDEFATTLGSTVPFPGRQNASAEVRIKFSFEQEDADRVRREAFDQLIDAGFTFVGDQSAIGPRRRRLLMPWMHRSSASDVRID